MFNIELTDKYYRSHAWLNTGWRGIQIVKFPGDLIMYQELIARIRPKLIIETGTLNGGSAVFFSDMQYLYGIDGEVITIDVQKLHEAGDESKRDIWNPRGNISYIIASSREPIVANIVSDKVATLGGPVLVVLDSDHSEDHVYAEMMIYSRFVTPGSYMVVEDTFPGPGAAKAVATFLNFDDGHWEVDRECEKFGITCAPGGWLRRRAE